jgi:hypothetical protein
MSADAVGERIAVVAKRFMKGYVAFYDPGAKGTYNSALDAYVGGTPDTLLFGSKARIQNLNESDAPKRNEDAGQFDFRLQIPLEAETVPLKKGHVALIIDGGRDPKLVGLRLQVKPSLNSSMAAVRTVNCVVEP